MKKKALKLFSYTTVYIVWSVSVLQVIDVFLERFLDKKKANNVFVYSLILLVVLYFCYIVYVYIKGDTIFQKLKNLKKKKSYLNNVPEYENKLINLGRINKITKSLKNNKVTTLVGVGGIGKTRLISEAAKRLEYEWEDGIFFFECENIQTLKELTDHFTLIMGSRVNVKGNDIQQLLPYICDFNSLFIFDNCEQASSVFEEFANLIIQNCKLVNIAFTSRIKLNIKNENVITIKKLSSEKYHRDACKLFVTTAGIKARTPSDKQKIVSICNRLDGIPLAIIIVAKRMKTFGLNEIYKNLESIVVSEGEKRKTKATERHDTIFNCINWSYNMLSKNEKDLLKTISLYPSVVSIDSLVEIFNKVQHLHSYLQSLYDNGFIINELLHERTYYKLPPLVREFVKAMPHPDADNFFMKKLSLWYTKFSVQIENKIYGKDSQKYLDVLDKEYLNIYATMKFCYEHNIPQMLIDFSYLYWYCFLRGKWSDFSPFFDIAIFNNLNHQNFGQIHLANGVLKWSDSNLTEADYHLREAVDLFNTCNYLWGKGQALHILGHVQYQMGNLLEAEKIYSESLSILKNYNEDYWKALLINDIAEIKLDLMLLDEAEFLLSEAKLFSKNSNDMHGYGNSLMHLSIVYRIEGKYRKSKKYILQAIKVFNKFCYQRGLGSCYKHLADIYIAQHNFKKAKKCLLQALLIQDRIGHRIGIIRTLESLSKYLSIQNQYSDACVFYLYCKTLRNSSHMMLVGYQSDELAKLETTILQHLNDASTVEQYVSSISFCDIIKKALILCDWSDQISE